MATVTMTTTLPPFNNLVAKAITDSTTVSPEDIIVLDNSAKYDPEGIGRDREDEDSLSAIFDTMANINRMALEDISLCAGEHGPGFRNALLMIASQLTVLAKGRPIRYVELGPEPWKSRAILEHMLATGAQLSQYIGIDINPESEHTMRDALAPIIGEERFAYWVKDFYKISADSYPKLSGDANSHGDCVTVVTNLGFQEGNDLPSRIGPMLKNLTRPGDLLLSEMQVLQGCSTGGGAGTIQHFYQLPEMRRFSALVGKRFDSTCPPDGTFGGQWHEYLFNLVPLQTEIGSVQVATTLVSVRIEGKKRYVLTNSCLKYTSEQFRRAREALGAFVVKSVQETGDQSVLFQIAERR